MTPHTGDFAFLPLGGTGEIGMNLNCYRLDGRWLAVDCGLGFGGSEVPEAEILLPDPSYLADRAHLLDGLVITHAHEDHIGAVAHLWPRLRCPVWLTPFAASILRRKLGEAGLVHEVRINVVPPGTRFRVGAFDLEFMRVAHSIPEAQALAIRTPHGNVLHTGDWKLDPEPLVGPPTDEDAFRRFGDEGVLAMVCDSTNAMVEGRTGSEATVRRSLAALVRSIDRGRVAVTCFASNVARVESAALAGLDAGRSACLVGRSLRNLDAAARENGYLAGVPEFVPEQHAGEIPDDNLLILVTGSQGEPRSALARIAADTHPNISLGEGDTVLFSSRMIPGNERAVMAVQDNLVRRGVRVMTDEDHAIHVSGHPARDELRALYALVRPRFAVPVHGEWRHLATHAALARECGAEPVMLEDGDILALGRNRCEVEDQAPVGRLAVDGKRVVPLSGGILAARKRMLFNGIVLASVAVDGDGRLRGAPRVSAPGLLDQDDPEQNTIAAEIARAIDELPGALRRDDTAFTEATRAAVRRSLGKRLQKRPVVDVHLLHV
jgi:ribonuclease J